MSMMAIQELWHNKQKSWSQETSLGAAEPGMVLIEPLYSLVSQGTERLVISQELSESLSARMAVPYMQGQLSTQFTYGYSLVGTITSGSEDLIGKQAHVLHPHQSPVFVKEEDVYLLPADFDPTVAAFASNMETAVNAIWDSQMELGDRLLIIGFGTVGALTALIAQHSVGVTADVLEKNQYRQRKARSLGVSVLSEITSTYDTIINASGNGQMLNEALRHTAHEGKVIELSWYGDQDISLHLGADFHYGRKQIISSQVSSLPRRKQANWDYRKRKDLVFRLLAELDIAGLVDHQVPWSDAAGFFNALRDQPRSELGILINYKK